MSGSRWTKFILMSGLVIADQIYDLSTATEAPSQTLLIMQYILIALAAFSFIGSIVMVMKERA
jgi:hypothetical protein